MQLRKSKKGWTEDEMALSARINSAKNQNKGSYTTKARRVKGRCHHRGKFGHRKENCKDWLKLTKEERDKADKRKVRREAKEKLTAY